MTEVFKHPKYLLLWASVSTIVFLFIILLPHVSLLVVVAQSAGLIELFKLIINLMGILATNYTFLSAAALILISIILGMNTALLGYYVKLRKHNSKKGVITNLAGFVTGLLGIGCAACGGLIFTPFLSTLGIGSALTILPFAGQELIWIGVGLLSVSTVFLIKEINKTRTCN